MIMTFTFPVIDLPPGLDAFACGRQIGLASAAHTLDVDRAASAQIRSV